MKGEMAESSLFAVLLRSQWWISAGIAALMIGVAMTLIPEPYHQYRIIGALTSLPFRCLA